MSSAMKLIWGSGSYPCWKAMLVLAEKGLRYESKLISFDKEEYKSDIVVSLNPRAQVPVFQDGDVLVNESTAICDYLESEYKNKGTQLIPDEKVQKGQVLQRRTEIQCNLEPTLLANYLYYYFYTEEKDIDQDLVEKKREALRTELSRWEKYLTTSGDYIVGQNFTMADVFLFPLIAISFRAGLGRDKYPRITAYFDKCMQRDSVKATVPPHWADNAPSMNVCADV